MSAISLIVALSLAIFGVVNGYSNTVMPNGDCNITSEDGLKVLQPVRQNMHVVATFWNPAYGTHVVVLGRDSKIYHKHQIAPKIEANWTAWKCLTPDFTKVPCSSAPTCRGYDSNPVVAWQPVNKTVIMFVRQMDDLDVHEFHLADPKDPDSWTAPRSPACLCNYPPCVNRKGKPDQTRCGAQTQCDNTGPDCNKTPSSGREFWNTSPAFPTSELSLVAEGDLLSLYFRGFDGAYYKSQQLVAGDAGGKFGAFYRLGGLLGGENAIIE